MNEQSVIFADLPVRLDATLCEPGEIWLEQPDGEVERIWSLQGDPPGPEEQA